MKRIKYIISSLVAIVAISSCDILDTTNLYNKDLDNFYQTPTDIEEAMNGVYNALFLNAPMAEEAIAATLMSDLVFAGGGPDDTGAKNMDQFSDPTEDTFRDLWVETYNGVYRANAVIEAVVNADYTAYFTTVAEAEAFKANALGRAHFMRGFLMFRAAKFFGGIPIIPATDSDRTVPRASFTETFTFIADDLLKSIEYFPKDNINNIPADDYGHPTIWAAKGFLARVYMFYTGYMTNIEKSATSELPLTEGALTKDIVLTHLNDLIDNSGHMLTPDYRNLWPYSHVNDSAKEFDENFTTPILPWAADNNLKWVGQDGPKSVIGTGNYEVIFALRYGLGNWGYDNGTGQKYNNRMALFFGIRGNSLVPFGEGWGWGTIHPSFVNEWSNDDIRKQGSVLVLGDETQGTQGWQGGKGDLTTGYMNKKYTTLQHGGVDGVKGMFYYIYDMNNGDPMQLWAAQDFYYLRYSDILLMHSELSEDVSNLNKVRERAGLEPLAAYSLEDLKKERMYEFAFEGVRWFDLVRWGDVETSNNYFSRSADVDNSGVEGTYQTPYRADIKGLVSIPETEIRLSNGVYQQNPGW